MLKGVEIFYNENNLALQIVVPFTSRIPLHNHISILVCVRGRQLKNSPAVPLGASKQLLKLKSYHCREMLMPVALEWGMCVASKRPGTFNDAILADRPTTASTGDNNFRLNF